MQSYLCVLFSAIFLITSAVSFLSKHTFTAVISFGLSFAILFILASDPDALLPVKSDLKAMARSLLGFLKAYGKHLCFIALAVIFLMGTILGIGSYLESKHAENLKLNDSSKFDLSTAVRVTPLKWYESGEKLTASIQGLDAELTLVERKDFPDGHTKRASLFVLKVTNNDANTIHDNPSLTGLSIQDEHGNKYKLAQCVYFRITNEYSAKFDSWKVLDNYCLEKSDWNDRRWNPGDTRTTVLYSEDDILEQSKWIKVSFNYPNNEYFVVKTDRLRSA